MRQPPDCVCVCVHMCVQVWVHRCGFMRARVQMCLSGWVALFVPLYVRENMCACVCIHMCVQTCMPELVCLFAHLCAGENMYVRVCVHTRVCAAGRAIHDTGRSGLSWEVFVPSPWLTGDDKNFLEWRAPEKPVFPGLALLIGSRKNGNPVFVWLRCFFLGCARDPGAQHAAP